MTVYLSAKNIRKTYGRSVALHDVSLELHQGEILALLGSNGAGKTTLIKILATLLTKDAGRVEIMGYDLDTHETEIRHLFGYVGQDTDRSAYARLSVRENLRFFGALRGLGKRQVDRQVDKLAEYFDFRAHLDKLFMTLSGGQKQTVVIMRALLYDPPIVYLDEPTKGLDPIVAQKIRAFLTHYAQKERKSLLLTSHILSEVDEMANRVALIHGGRISVTGTSAELKMAVGVQAFIDFRKDSLSPTTQAQLSQLAAVLPSPQRDPEWISFGLADAFEGTEAILHVLRENQGRPQFRQRTVSLEDAFVHHIGVLAEKFEN